VAHAKIVAFLRFQSADVLLNFLLSFSRSLSGIRKEKEKKRENGSEKEKVVFGGYFRARKNHFDGFPLWVGVDFELNKRFHFFREFFHERCSRRDAVRIKDSAPFLRELE
jgi:hypothetical protein